MKLVDIFKRKEKKEEAKTFTVAEFETKFKEELDLRFQAFNAGGIYGGWNRVMFRPFDGEKTLGGMGVINKYAIDHDSLRLRSWQLMLESEIVQIGIMRYAMWLIGGGLQLRAQPDRDVLSKFGINLDIQAFCKEIEGFWKLYSNNEISDSAGMVTLHAKIWEAVINALVGGDCLFIIQISDDNIPTVKLVDGSHICTPVFTTNFSGIETINPDTGNRVRQGIEIDSNDQHVAYYVRKGGNYGNNILDFLNFDRIVARDKGTGFIRAFMFYGVRYRLDNIRGIPIISACMETTKQLEQYKSATVEGAVERAKIVLYSKQEINSTGGNPFDPNLMRATGGAWSGIPTDTNGVQVSNNVAATNNRQFLHTDPGTELKAIDSKQEIHFSEFYDTNMNVLFAAIGIPKEIALMLFGSNYSASRASIKDWEHTLKVKRFKDVSPAYKNFYNIFMLTQVFSNNIDAPGYIDAVMNNKMWIKLAYHNSVWIGDNPPNIDELKEVMAAKAKLGEGSHHLPLETPENICMDLGILGDYYHILDEYQAVLEYADKIGIEKVEVKNETIENFDEPVKPAKKEKKDK